MTRSVFAVLGASIGYWIAVVAALLSWDIVVGSAETGADRRSAESLGEQVAILAQAPVLDGNRPALSHLLARMASVPMIEGMWIYGVDGEALATAGTLSGDDVLVFPVVNEANVAAYLRVAIAERPGAGPGVRALAATFVVWPVGWIVVVFGVYLLARPRRGRTISSVRTVNADATRETTERASATTRASGRPAPPRRDLVRLVIRSSDEKLATIGTALASTYSARFERIDDQEIRLDFAIGDDDVFEAVCAGLLMRRIISVDYRGVVHVGSSSDAELVCGLAEADTLLLTSAGRQALKTPERAELESLDHPAIATLDEKLSPCSRIVDAAPSHRPLLDRQAARLERGGVET